ncbi:zwei Ig domain protein zig-8 isoform X2 [Cephus cinctus]|uniref:Zwei Ig domain protein zig-8 isoform X2 n=1 Tax=Cephus cinctus TaxID=211228 RepID=A0AAJ7FMF8_CEPCN|nr:zwei Ig domain protein zig-8 isoform X2 [Cephus cinctus]
MRQLENCQKEVARQGRRAFLSAILLFILPPSILLSAPVQHLDGVPGIQDDAMEVPVFEQTVSNVSAFQGQTAYLPCRVRNLGDKIVSWMRSSDLHILTSGDFLFSSDTRFASLHAPGSDAWTLRLNNTKKSDSGKYECQVNSEPKIMYAVRLFVLDPDKLEGYDEPYSQQTRISYESTAPIAAIMGPREQRVPAGSTITLRCVVTSPYQTRLIRGVQWLRDNKLLTFQAARGGINVQTDRRAAQTVSELTLAAVTEADVGKYSCRPLEGRADVIDLVVEAGERTEAMQRDAGYVSSASDVTFFRMKGTFAWTLLTVVGLAQTYLY